MVFSVQEKGGHGRRVRLGGGGGQRRGPPHDRHTGEPRSDDHAGSKLRGGVRSAGKEDEIFLKPVKQGRFHLKERSLPGSIHPTGKAS
jgi:hypothetical protein